MSNVNKQVLCTLMSIFTFDSFMFRKEGHIQDTTLGHMNSSKNNIQTIMDNKSTNRIIFKQNVLCFKYKGAIKVLSKSPHIIYQSEKN